MWTWKWTKTTIVLEIEREGEFYYLWLLWNYNQNLPYEAFIDICIKPLDMYELYKTLLSKGSVFEL